MKYKLINNGKIFDNYKEQVLFNRGIINPKKYLSLDNSAIQNFNDLSNIQDAVELLLRHIENNSKIVILVDKDVDGITSSAMFYNYIKNVFSFANLNYLIHTKKSHGLTSNIRIPEDTKLLLLIDAGSNDVKEAKALKEKGIDIIVLDHHICESENPYAIIVNCQSSPNYKNKFLSGAGVVYQFLRAVDSETWENKANNYLDLAAFGIIADSMDCREEENRRIIDLGLSNIHNKAFLAIAEKQSYSTGNIINPISVAFYLVPPLNATIRMGTQEENELLFRAFIETDETFPYKKRDGTEIQETIYDRVARLSINNKSKQGRETDKAIGFLKEKIGKYKWDENKILFCDASEIEGNLSGLIAIKLANEYNKPCVLLRENGWKPEYFGGSIRNYDGSSIENLKEFLLSTDQFEFIMGHSNAAGLSLLKNNVRKVIQITNEMLKDVQLDKTYYVDFILQPEELDFNFIQEISALQNYYGQGISECLIALESVIINTSKIEIIGENRNTWKFSINDGECVIIKFKADENDPVLNAINNDWGGTDLKLKIVGKCNISSYNQILTPQLIVQDFEVCL